ncbi:MAG TPA: hypothetical protein VF932_15720 [Anaerolineae bacterium]
MDDHVPLPLANTPDDIWIVVAGGAQSGHSYWMQHGTSWSVPQTKEIKLPAKAKWDALLAQAEKDLGPVPAI